MFWKKSEQSRGNEASRSDDEATENADEFAQGCWPKELFERVTGNKNHDIAVLQFGKITNSSIQSFSNTTNDAPFEIKSKYEFDDLVYLSGTRRHPIIAEIAEDAGDRFERNGELIASADHHVGYFRLTGKNPSPEMSISFKNHYRKFYKDRDEYKINVRDEKGRFSLEEIPCVTFLIFGRFWERFSATAFDALRHMRPLNEIPTIRFITKEPLDRPFKDVSREDYYTDPVAPIERFVIREDYDSVGLYLEYLGVNKPG